MDKMTELEQLKQELKTVREELDAVLRILWDMRGMAKAEHGRIEKELEKPFKDYLERNK
jgi:hypothetical protein